MVIWNASICYIPNRRSLVKAVLHELDFGLAVARTYWVREWRWIGPRATIVWVAWEAGHQHEIGDARNRCDKSITPVRSLGTSASRAPKPARQRPASCNVLQPILGPAVPLELERSAHRKKWFGLGAQAARQRPARRESCECDGIEVVDSKDPDDASRNLTKFLNYCCGHGSIEIRAEKGKGRTGMQLCSNIAAFPARHRQR